MEWLFIGIIAVIVYALVAGYIKYSHIWEDHITFYGPILALKTEKVGFFDYFRRQAGFWRGYGTLGAILVVVISVLMSALLVLGVYSSLMNPPAPEGIYEPQNILAIPGVNDFIPITYAVIIAFFITLLVHEFGHAILCRVEDIRVKSTGILFAVIPIGAFVEPDEEEVENAPRPSKIRMYGAGITNNLVVALVCFVAIVGLMGMATPLSTPIVKGVYVGYPADLSGISPDSVISAVDGVPVESVHDVSDILQTTAPGDTLSVTTLKDGMYSDYSLVLEEWPKDLSNKTSGFMGVVYYSPESAQLAFNTFVKSPIGPLLLLYVPINTVIDDDSLNLGILAFDVAYAEMWDVPFSGFWGVVQVLFWTFWFNLAVGTFNALPFIPLDGGYIMQEGVTGILEKRGRKDLVPFVVSLISSFMVAVMLLLLVIPYIFG
ncbi:site-2 protease family protein [Methanogenium organophilum]|uniref:Site-2 protease family protein n=1 Tax=Methanogenium organophilum TaxID=2199 RepID=A0A9X9S4K0_METOG|nr:site-2 protease family protein [Methanogenium organophilum]WAI00785.1 site-2 protease family protein [Methanogenium organophilum]